MPVGVEELRSHLRELAAASPFASDPAPEGMVRSVRISLDKKHGEGAAEKIARVVFKVISLEEATKAQAMAMQNALGVSNGQWAEAVQAIMAMPDQPEEPEPLMDEREYADVIGADYEEPEPVNEEAEPLAPPEEPEEEPPPAAAGPANDPVVQAAIERYGAEVAGVESPEPQQGKLSFGDQVDADDAFAPLEEADIPF